VTPYAKAMTGAVSVALLALWWLLGGPTWVLAAWITGGIFLCMGIVAGQQHTREAARQHLAETITRCADLQKRLDEAEIAKDDAEDRAEKAEARADFADDLAASHLIEIQRLRRELIKPQP